MNNSSLPTLTLGLDLGDRRHSFCLIDAEARILEEASVPNSSEALAALSARLPEARIVIETGTQLPANPHPDCLRFSFPQERRPRITAVHRSHEHPMR